MKKLKKSLSVFLAIIMLISVFSASTTVFAEEYVKEQMRLEYFDDNLSEYLKDVVNTDDAIKITEVEENQKNTSDENIDLNQITLELDNGEKTAYVFSEDICFFDDDGKLVYKETDIVEADSSLYDYENGENDYKTYFSSDPDIGVMFKNKNGCEIKLVPFTERTSVGTIIENETEDGKSFIFNYDKLFSDESSLRYIPQLNSCKEEIILNKYEGINTFKFTLYTGENTAAINSFGQIEIMDEERNIVDTLSAPYAYDASSSINQNVDNKFVDCEYVLEKITGGEYYLSINVPEDYLTSSDTVYPVTIDPTESDISQLRDTSVYSLKPNTTHSSNETNCIGKSGEYGFGRVLTVFHIPDEIEKYATIDSAYIWIRETTGRTATMNVRPYILTGSWNNSVTWNTMPEYGDYTCAWKNINGASTDGGPSVHWYKFDIKKALKAWTSGTTNRGIAFISRAELTDSSALWRAFASIEHSTSSYRPYAVITYRNDTKKPTIDSVSQSVTSWTTGSVKLTVNASDLDSYGNASEYGVKQYSFDNGVTWQTSKSKSFTENQTVSIKVKDYAGNISLVKTHEISNIDNTDPTVTISLNPSGWTNSSVSTTFTIEDNAAIAYYVLNGTTRNIDTDGSEGYTKKTYTKSYSSNTDISITVYDAAGNSKTVTKSISKIDKVAPTISSVSGSPNSWTNGNITLTVSASDADSGLASEGYSFDNGTTWQTGKSKIVATRDTINVKVKDKAGNISDVYNFTPLYDNEKPVINSVTGNPDSWTNQDVTLTVNAVDAGDSGIESYSFDNGASWQPSNSKTFHTNQTVNIKVKDKAGNISDLTTVDIAKIDKDPPAINSISKSPESWTDEKVTLSVSATDSVTQVSMYSFDNGVTWQSSSSKEFDINQTVNIKVKDEVGNESGVVSVLIDKIDKDNPVITSVDAPTEWTNTDVTVVVHANDGNGSGVASYSFNNGQSWNSSSSRVYGSYNNIKIIVRDALGHESAVWNQEIKIDKLPPNVTISGSCEKWTNQTVYISIGGDDVGGSHIWGYSYDGGNTWISGEVMPYSNSSDEILQIWVKDFVGNIAKRTARLMIDKEEPIINSVTVNQNDKWNNEEVTIVVDATDIYEGIAAHSDISAYSFDGGINWQEENTHLYNTKTENIIIAVKDNAGNISYYTENESDKLYTTDIDKATPIDIKPFDTKAPLAPDIYEENGLVYISSRSFDFNKETDSPEHIEYKIGANGTWTEYNDEPLEVVRTVDTTIYARVCDEAGNISQEASFTLESTLGEYTASYIDIALGEGLFPVPFGRTYSSNNGWFFTFEANVQPFTNGYVFTDFYGEKQYFIKNSKGQYLSVDEEELTVTTDENEEVTSFELVYGDMTCTFNSDGKLIQIKTDYLETDYTWENDKLIIDGGSIVTFAGGKPTGIEIERENKKKTIEYNWTTERFPETDEAGTVTVKEIIRLTSFKDAAGKVHTYNYLGETELLTKNDTETIAYSDEGRVKKITQPNNSFVKYTYKDTTYENETDGVVEKAVIISDSKGVTDTISYSDGVYISSSLDSYSDKAIYAPNEISADITTDAISNIVYVVESEPQSEEQGTDEPSTGGDPESDGENATDNEAEDVINGEENDAEQGEDNNAPSEPELPLYETTDENTYVFYDYDEQNRVATELTVIKSKIADITTATFEDAKKVVKTETVYVYASETDNTITDKYIFTYSDDVKLQTEELYQPTNNVLFCVSKFTYDSNENIVLEQYFKQGAENETTIEYENFTRVYDGENLLSETQQTLVDGVLVDTKKLSYEYYEDGNIKAETQEILVDAVLTETKKISYEYDVWKQQTGIVVKQMGEADLTTKITYDELGNTSSVTEDGVTVSYEYSNGNVSKVAETKEFQQNNGTNVTKTVTSDYGYSNGNLVNRTNTTKVGEDVTETTVASYVYDEYGNLNYYEFNGYAFTYNTLGSILTAKAAVKEDENGNKTSVEIVSYTYSNDIKQEVLHENFGNGQTVTYDYNEDGEISAVKLGEETKFGYEYSEPTDENGEETEEWIELTDYVNGLKKKFEENKTTVNDLNDNFVYSIENVTKDEDDADSFDGKIEKSGYFVYKTEYCEDRDRYSSAFSGLSRLFEYNDDGDLSEVSFNFGNSIGVFKTQYDYNVEKSVSLLTHTLKDLTKEYSYTYENENIATETLTTTSKDENGATVETIETTNYNYDESNQLSSVENNSTKWEYSYDSRGNIESKKEYAVSIDENEERVYALKENGEDTYSYDTEWADKLTGYNGQSITYDASGNPTNYLGHNLTWTMGRQLASYDSNTYTYDENGIRTSKTSNGVTTEYYLDGTRLVEQTDETNTLHFNYDRTGEVIGFTHYYLSTGYDDPIMAEYIYVKNAQGDIVGITSPSGKMKVSYTYDPWGRLINIESDLDPYERDIATLNPFRYRGYYYDTETGLYYLQSRYYDPETGRFINCDDVNYIGVSDTAVSYNAFAYCENDPVNGWDPSGRLQKEMATVYEAINYFQTLNASSKERSAYIYDQNIGYISNLIYGGFPISYNGCELIAVYNALKYLGKFMLFYKVIYYAEINDWYLFPVVPTGVFGSTPRKAKKLFDEKNLKYTIYQNYKSKDFEKNIKDGKICIATYSNKSSKLMYNLSIHTFAFYYDKKRKKYYTFNGYNTYSDKEYAYNNYSDLRKGGRYFLYGIILK